MKDQIVVSATWAMILVLGTVLSPVLVALINRLFDVVMAIIKAKQEKQKEYNNHIRALYEDFLTNAAEASRNKKDRVNLKLIDSYYLLLPYIPSRLADDLHTFVFDFANKTYSQKDRIAFTNIILEIKKSLDPQQRTPKWSKWRKEWRYKD